MLEGQHYQNAYVTRDIDKAVARVTARADVRSVVQFEATTEVLTAAGTRPHNIKLAFIWVGDLQYEFIEPIAEAVPMFATMLPNDDLPRFHHSCARVPDWDDFRRRVDQQPYPVVIEGASGGDLKFLFLDTRDLLGHYLEYTWMTNASWERLGGRREVTP
jgi:Glyoxalase/Bleomycin resistance protein/Dioxygenase superfamily